MAGHARERRPGVWELRAYAGRDPLTGKKRTETKTVRAGGRKEAQRLADAFAVEIRSEPVSADMTFKELLDKWYELVKPRLVPAGQREYRWMIDQRLRPLHDIKLTRLGDRTGTALLDQFYVALRDRGGMCRRQREKCTSMPCDHGGGGPLAGGTVIRTHVVIHAALEQAMKWGAIARNPAAFATPGEVDAAEIEPPAPADVARLFKLAEDEDPELVVLLVLASTTGARRGRVLALWWEDLDLDRGIVKFGHVLSRGAGGPVRVPAGRGSKNRKGKKNDVPLDPAIVAVLLAHRARCVARCAMAGVDLPERGYVFAGDGIGHQPWNPDSTSRRFARLRDEAGLDETRLHDLRHFVVSYLLASGADLAVIKDLVGHAAGSATTLNEYAHAVTENKRAATGILAKLLELGQPPAPEPAPDDEPLAKVIPFKRRDADAVAR